MQDLMTRPDCEFLSDVISGLSSAQKRLPCKYFYDEKGSDLFEQITNLDEYYPTRTELKLLKECAPEFSAHIPQNVRVVEYGAGALRKIRILLDALETPSGFVPIDVSETFLLNASKRLQTAYPELEVSPVTGNFLDPELNIPSSDDPSLGFFPGSTLGNLNDREINTFLSKARQDLSENGQFLLGVDVNQNPETLIPAYNDADQITAEFNKNLLARINNDLDADFDLSAFYHDARWNDATDTIEMHLVSKENQTVTIDEQTFEFLAGETIHTENSRKFSVSKIDQLAQNAGWNIQHVWTSPSPSMALFLLN